VDTFLVSAATNIGVLRIVDIELEKQATPTRAAGLLDEVELPLEKFPQVPAPGEEIPT